jgi:PIN domain nuclease of toxin-antitoxin system/antitoxin (DNA-binding transcriptional repressor) of toxin-antitoxin stability system
MIGHVKNKLVNVAAAKARLPELIERAAGGETIILARGGKPRAKLVPLQPSPRAASKRIPGKGKGALPDEEGLRTTASRTRLGRLRRLCVRLLLDTQTFVWWDNARLPKAVVRRIRRAEDVLVSAVAAWEVAIKGALGKMTGTGSVAEAIGDYGFTALPIVVSHGDAVRALPAPHRDPFDRLLVAQAMVEDLAVLSADEELRRYEVAVLWD